MTIIINLKWIAHGDRDWKVAYFTEKSDEGNTIQHK